MLCCHSRSSNPPLRVLSGSYTSPSAVFRRRCLTFSSTPLQPPFPLLPGYYVTLYLFIGYYATLGYYVTSFHLYFIGYYATQGNMWPIILCRDYHSYRVLCNPLTHYLVLCNLYTALSYLRASQIFPGHFIKFLIPIYLETDLSFNIELNYPQTFVRHVFYRI